MTNLEWLLLAFAYWLFIAPALSLTLVWCAMKCDEAKQRIKAKIAEKKEK